MSGNERTPVVEIQYPVALADTVRTAYSPQQWDGIGKGGMCTAFRECREGVTNPVRTKMNDTAAKNGMNAEWKNGTTMVLSAEA